MRKSAACLLTASLITCAASQKVVQLDTRGTHPAEALRLARRDTVDAYLLNGIFLYTINVTIGDPPQSFQLQLDTGSTDVWVNSADSEYCQQGNCLDSFDSSKSSSYKVDQPGVFNVTYGDGTGAAGDYFLDTLTFGGVSVTGQTMGLATTSDINQGLLGVGMTGTEGSCSVEEGPQFCYPNVIDTLVTEGKINSHAFSLYLNDLNQSTGSILFGGVDAARYSGDLVQVPMVGIPLYNGSQETDRYTVAWTNFTITTPNGVEQFLNQEISVPALLDSGTTLAILPSAITQIIFDQMGAVVVDGSGYAPCYLRVADATIDFGIGGADGLTISVPLRELLLDLDTETAKIWHDLGGPEYCQVGVQASDDDFPIFGDVILRSAYIVYDLDNRQVAIAQANFEPGKADIKEITNGTTSNIPGVARTAATVSSLSSVSGATNGPVRNTGSAQVTDTAALSTASVVPLASFTTADYTGQGGYTAMDGITTTAPTATGSSSSSSGAASAMTVPKAGFEGVTILSLVSVFMGIGAAMIVL